MNYLPSTSEIEILRRLFQNRVGDAWYAVLGDRLGTGARTDVPGKPGWVYIMFLNGGDANGNVSYTAPTMVRAAGVAFPNVPGTGLWVGYGYDGDLCVKAAHNKALDAMGINTQVLNPLNQQSRFVYPWQLTYGLASAVGNSTTPSTLVTVKKIRHYTGGNLLQPFDTPLQADKIDLASYIPAADTHCYAMVWLDTYTNDPAVTTSVTQALSSPLSDADLQECVVRSASSRPPDAIPFKAFYLSNDQGSITQSDLDVDVRQWLDMPNVLGFPNVLTTLERIRANYTFVTGPFTTSGVGDLDTSETGARLLIVHKSNISTSAPTVNDDSDDGYSVGSRWFRSSTGVLYVATDVTVGAAVWVPVAASGGSFAPDNATYLLQVANGSLPNAQAMGALSTGIVKSTTGTGVQSIAVAGTDYTSPTGTENLSNKTITASSLVATALSVLIGGFKGIFTHANSADRTYTFPNYDGTIATLAGTEALSNKTINTSDIGTTTPGAGYFNALRLKIGGFFGIFTHANTADRTYTLKDASGTVAFTSDITNPPFIDTQTIIKGSADATKLLRFEVDSFTTATTRVLTPPDYDGTIATLAGAETLTNKTLTSPKINEILDSNGNEELKFTTTASAVNELTVGNAATGNKPGISASGGDTNIGIDMLPKGTGVFNVDGAMVINESGADRDVRIEGDTNTNLLFTDASNDNVGIGTNTPTAGALLHLVSTTKASIPAPSMTAAQRDAIGSPAAGMLVYLNDQYDFSMYDANAADWTNLRAPFWSQLLDPFSRHVVVSGTAMVWVSNTGQAGAGYYHQSTPAVNNQVSYSVSLPVGTYIIELLAVKNNSSAIMSLIFDGSTVATYDLYNAAGVFNFRDFTTGFNITTPGVHTFSIKAGSKNASSTNYDMLLSWFQFIRTGEYP